MSCTTSNTPSVSLTWVAGDTEHFVINRLDPDSVPIDMTGMTGTMSLRRKVTDPTAALTVTAVITIAEGKLDFTASADQTRAILAGRASANFVFDCQVTDGVNVTTIVGGTIYLSLDVTR